MKTVKSVPTFYFLLFILLVECMHFVMCLNMWTSLEQKHASNKTPVKKCVSPCRIFHSWCKNEGKCREKGPDCTWYCECPDNCEGFFCEKVVEKDSSADGGQSVEVKVTYEKEKKKPVSAFDKSKLAQALAGIYLKEKQTDEEKKTVLPDTIERVGKTIKTKENVTEKVILNCPPGEMLSKGHAYRSTVSTNKTSSLRVTNSSINSTTDASSASGSKQIESATSEVKKITNTSKQPPVTASSDPQSTRTLSTSSPIVKSSFSVTSEMRTVTATTSKQTIAAKSLESTTHVESNGSELASTVSPTTVNSNEQVSESSSQSNTGLSTATLTTTQATLTTNTDTTVSQLSTVPTQTKATSTNSTSQATRLSTKNNSDQSAREENSLYIENKNIKKISDKPNLLDIIEKAIEIEYITTTTSKQHTSPIKSTTESLHDYKSSDLTTKTIELKKKTTVSSSLLTKNGLSSLKNVTEMMPNEKSQISEGSSNVTVSSRKNSDKSTSADELNITKETNDTNYIGNDKPLINNYTTNKLSTTKQNGTIGSLITNQTTENSDPSADIRSQNVTDIPLTQSTFVTGHNTTTNGKTPVQTTASHETLKITEAVITQTNSKSTMPPVERPIHVQTEANIISTTRDITTLLKTKFDTSTIKTTTQISSETKKPETRVISKISEEDLAQASTKNDINLPDQKVATDSMGINKSPHDNKATGEINTLSSTNVPSVNLSQVIKMSHDMPNYSKLDMSTVQTVMSNKITTEQQISTSSFGNIKKGTTIPPTTEHNIQPSSSSTIEKMFTETVTASTNSQKTYKSTVPIKSKIFKEFITTLMTTEALDNNTVTNKKLGVEIKSRDNSEMISQTTPISNISDILKKEKLRESEKDIIPTSETPKTTTHKNHGQVTTPTSTSETITYNIGLISSTTTTKGNVTHASREAEFSTVTTPKKIKSIETTTSENSAGHVQPNLTDASVPQPYKTSHIVESITQTISTTNAHLDRNEQTTGSVIYSEDVGGSELSLTKSFLDPKSELKTKSEVVKNELLSDSLRERVKDLKIDLLHMGSRDKGLPSDLDNIL